MTDRYRELIERARTEEPFGSPRKTGFETRLRAALGAETPGVLDLFGTLCWRVSLTCLPVFVPSAIWTGVLSRTQFPGGMSDVLVFCSSILPVDPPPFF